MDHRNGYVKRFNVDKKQPKLGRTVNYDFATQEEPSTRMGENDFANMPEKPMIKAFSRSHDYRSGVVNAFDCGLEKDSGINENRSY